MMSVPRYSPIRNRVLMVISTLVRGGSERQLVALLSGLASRGYEAEVFTLASVPPGEPGFEAELAALGTPVRTLPPLPDVADPEAFEAAAAERGDDPHRLRYFVPLLHAGPAHIGTRLESVITRFRPRVVHCWANYSNVVGGMVALSLDVPRIVLSQRNASPAQEGDKRAWLYRAAYRDFLADPRVAILNNSKTNIAAYERWIASPPGRIRLVYNGFMPASMTLRRGAAAVACRRALGIPPDATVIGGLMRLAPEKDPVLWLRTAALLAAMDPRVRFLLAGYGHLMCEIKDLAARLGIAGRLVLPGPVTDIGSIYAAMDAFLLTSRIEGVPNVLLEAQAAGLPIVAADVGGTGEALLFGLTGLLVRSRAPEDFTGALAAMLDDPSWRSRAAYYGPSFVAERFGHERMIDEVLALYGAA